MKKKLLIYSLIVLIFSLSYIPEIFAECPEGKTEVIQPLPNGRVQVRCMPNNAAGHFKNIPGTYVIEQISEGPYGADSLKMNDNGYIVWRTRVGNNTEIFLYDGFTVEQISTHSNGVWDPQINNNNFVIWEQHDGNDMEIWRYYKGETLQISNNKSNDDYPQMNNRGQIVWQTRDDAGYDWEISLFVDSSKPPIQLTDNSCDDRYPRIFDNGFVTWEQTCFGKTSEIWLYDGSTTEQITKNEIWHRQPSYMTSTGNVIWLAFDEKSVNLYSYVVSTGQTLEESLVIGYNYALGPGPILNDEYLSWIGRPLSGPLDWVLFLYDGIQTISFPFYYRSDDPSDFWFEMNSNGNLVWHEADEGATPFEDYEIYFYDGSNIIRLTDNSYTDTYPHMNENSYIVWTAYVDSLDEEIFLYDGSNTIQLTDNS
jgi:hypothetical protein